MEMTDKQRAMCEMLAYESCKKIYLPYERQKMTDEQKRLCEELATKWAMDIEITVNTDIRDLYKAGFAACAELDQLEIAQLKAQLQMTNSNWPHEKALHDEIKALKARIGTLEAHFRRY